MLLCLPFNFPPPSLEEELGVVRPVLVEDPRELSVVELALEDS